MSTKKKPSTVEDTEQSFLVFPRMKPASVVLATMRKRPFRKVYVEDAEMLRFRGRWQFGPRDVRFTEVEHAYLDAVIVHEDDFEDVLSLKPNAWLQFCIKYPSLEDILRLANEHGFLYQDMFTTFSGSHANIHGIFGESLLQWYSEMYTFYIAKKVYKSIKEDDIQLAREELPRMEDFDFWVDGYASIFGRTLESGELIYDGKFDDAVALASKDQLFSVLEKIVNPRINNIRYRVSQSVNGHSMSLNVEPKDLSTALWIQFAQFIARNSKILRCVHCGKDFIHFGKGTHKKKTLCSGACKTDKCREKKKSEGGQ